MATTVLQVPEESLVAKAKQACKMLMGVASVKVQKEAKPKEYDITKTAGFREAMDDIKHGRVYHADSVDDMLAGDTKWTDKTGITYRETNSPNLMRIK